MNGGGDQLARGAKSATFEQPKLGKDGKNLHGQTWEDIFGPAEKKEKKPKK